MALEIPFIREATAAKVRFIWTDTMDQEYNTVRKTMLTKISLKPFDDRKTLRLMIDGALMERVNKMNPSEGAVIGKANCSRFKESQLHFSPIEAEAEAIALDLAISCCSYWIDYCPQG